MKHTVYVLCCNTLPSIYVQNLCIIFTDSIIRQIEKGTTLYRKHRLHFMTGKIMRNHFAGIEWIFFFFLSSCSCINKRQIGEYNIAWFGQNVKNMYNTNTILKCCLILRLQFFGKYQILEANIFQLDDSFEYTIMKHFEISDFVFLQFLILFSLKFDWKTVHSPKIYTRNSENSHKIYIKSNFVVS